MSVWPSREVALLLKQHGAIRHQLGTVELEAYEVQIRGHEALPSLAVALAQLGAALDEHNEAEEAALGPLLRSLDAWGPQRVEQMLEHHRAEHAALGRELHELTAVADPIVAGREALRLCEELRRHMAGEEREYLNARVLRDDLVAVDANAG